MVMRTRHSRDHSQAVQQPAALAAAAALSGAAGILHGAVIPAHLEEGPLVSAFFIAAALGQLASAAAIWRWPHRLLLAAAAIGNSAVVALWVLSRTAGPPAGPNRWQPEPVGLLDTVCTGLEVGLILLVSAVVWRLPWSRHLAKIGPPDTVVPFVAAITLATLYGGLDAH